MEAFRIKEFPLFSSFSRLSLTAAIIDYALGIIGNLTLIFLWWKHRHEVSDKYSILIISADLLGIAILLTESMSFSLEGFGDNRWGPGVNYCLAIGIGSFATCLTNLLCITLYAFQRYQLILQREPIPLFRCFIIILVYCLFCLIVGITAFFLGTPFIYNPAGTYCLFDWRDKSAPTMIPIVFGCIAITGCLSSLLFMYYKIYQHIRRVSLSLVGSHPVSTLDSKVLVVTVGTSNGMKGMGRDFSSKEKSLLKRVIIIVLVCFFCYTPYFLSAAYQVLFQNTVPPTIDAVCADLISANGLLDFLVFITTNASYRRRFWGLFGIKMIF